MRKSIETIRLEKKEAYEKELKLKEKEDPNYGSFIAFKFALVSYETDNIELAGFKFVHNEIQAKIFSRADRFLLDVRSKSGLYAHEEFVKDEPLGEKNGLANLELSLPQQHR